MSRADRVSDRLDAEQLDLLLVTNLVNVRYLTGFTGSNGLAIVGGDVRRFLTDFRYVEMARAQVPDFDRAQAPHDFLTALGEGWPEGELRVGFVLVEAPGDVRVGQPVAPGELAAAVAELGGR